jgi:hypothetical protein
VISRVQENDEVPEIEQRASAGAALGYVVLAADLRGYGAMAVSGRKVATQAMRHAFHLADNEELLCFVRIGTPTKLKGASMHATMLQVSAVEMDGAGRLIP